MISEELQNKLLEVFDKRFQDYNTKVLQNLGRIIKEFSTLTPSEAHKLAQVLRYDLSVKDLLTELAKITGKSTEDLKKILEKTAEENLQFSKIFYEARGLDVPIYKEHKALQRLVNGVFLETGGTLRNLSKSTGFVLLGANKEPLYLNIDETYKEVIDRCVIAVSQGKETYYQTMRGTMKELANSGVRYINYDNVGKTKKLLDEQGNVIKEITVTQPYTQRLDTAVRRNILDGMRQVSNASNYLFGQEYGADGVEISVHEIPAPDHEQVQGHQFSLEEFSKFQSNQDARDVNGNLFTAEFEGKDRRSISELNCYHYIFNVVLGVSEPLYAQKELDSMIARANNKIEFDGQEYTKYECTQLQRQIETAIRKNKDLQILGRASGDNGLVLKSQLKIMQLTQKYRELSNISGLPDVLDRRATVSGYKRIAKSKLA